MEDVQYLSKDLISSILPHGEEHVCIEKVEVYDDKCIAYRTYTDVCKEVEGHFPKYKVVPGHWIVEAMLQSAVFCPGRDEVSLNHTNSRVLSLRKADFIKEVVPGDTVKFTIVNINSISGMYTYSCTASVKDELVSRAEFVVK